MVEVETHYTTDHDPADPYYVASLGRHPEQFPVSGVGATPMEAVTRAVDVSHRAYGDAMPKLDAEPSEDDYSEQI